MKKLFLILFLVVIFQFSFGAKKIEAATYLWNQTDWSAGNDINNFANHTSNQSNWTKYFSKDSILTTSNNGELTISSIGTSLVETLDEEFSVGTTNSVSILNDAVSLSIDDNHISQLFTSYYHTCALKNNGTVFCWGFNGYGQLGIGNTVTPKTTPQQVLGVDGSGFLTGVVAITGGEWFNCALKNDGTVYCWGANVSGQLGINNLVNKSTPQQVKGVDGSGFLTGVSSISGGYEHVCARKTDGTVYCWGYNLSGQLGINNTVSPKKTPQQVLGLNGSGLLTDVNYISTGNYHTCVAKTDGTVYCWGTNTYGQLGINSILDKTTPQQVKGVDGSGFLTGVSSVTLGFNHSCSHKTDGTVYCWGYNVSGQLGIGNTVSPKTTPQQVLGLNGSGNLTGVSSLNLGGGHSCALKTDATVYCWGRNDYGQLGIGNTVTPKNTPQQVLGLNGSGDLTGVIFVEGGASHTCATKTDGTVYCWGRNDNGQLGLNNLDSPKTTIQQVKGTGGVGFLDIVETIYSALGNFISKVIDLGQNSALTILSFGITTPANTTLKFQLKSAATSSGLSEATWYGPTGTDDYYTDIGTTINTINNGNRFIQYKAFLETTNNLATPSLNDITINYKYYNFPGGSANQTSDADFSVGTTASTTISGDAVALNPTTVGSFCPSSFTVDHVAGAVAPVTKTITYGAKESTLTGTNMCWITQNLGADHQASSAGDDTESSAGWYWKFNSKRGYASVSSVTNPSWTDAGDSSAVDWQTVNDPCASLLGTGWRIPTQSEWNTAAGAGVNNFSNIGIHKAGGIWNNFGSQEKGSSGYYWTSTRESDTWARYYSYSRNDANDGKPKNQAFSVRCIQAIQDSVFPTSGTYISAAIDTGQISNFNTIAWGSTLPSAATTVKFQLRSSNSEDLTGATWYGPTSTDDYYTTSNANINVIHNGHRYIQYKAFLDTSNTAQTPTLNDVTISYKLASLSGSLISSPYDTVSNDNILSKIEWIKSTPTNTAIKFQVRTAANSGNIIAADWKGPDGTSTSYFTDNLGIDSSMPSTVKDSSNDQWIQYKAFFETTDTSAAPTLYDTTLTYVVNAPPSFNTSYETNGFGLTAGTAGTVNFLYSVGDTDTEEGSLVNRNKIWPTFYYTTDNGNNWIEIDKANLTGPNQDSPIALTSSSEYKTDVTLWNAGATLANSYNTIKIKMELDDGEAANNSATIISDAFILDIKKPDVGGFGVGGTGININNNAVTSLGVDKTNSRNVTIYFNATDDSDLQLKYSTAADFTGASYQSYVASIGFTLPTGDGVKRVYVKFKDYYGNESEAYSDVITLDTTAPITPASFSVQDISNVDIGEMGLFVNWGKSNETDWLGYKLYESTNGTDFNLKQTISNINSNYVLSVGLSNATTYTYRITAFDDLSNESVGSTEAQTIGAGAGDTTPPIITAIQVSDKDNASATINWTTDEVANSTVLYSTDSNYNTIQGSVGYLENHSVVLTGLSANTTYNYKVKSIDVSGNSTLSDSGTFTTDTIDITGPTITDVGTSSLTLSSATLTWNTNESANSFVEYSTLDGFSSGVVKGQNDSVSSHTVVLTTLDAGTTYYYKVRSTDTSGNLTVSSQGNFSTSIDTSDVTAPVISNIDTTNIAYNGATINWTTNELATSYVEYGTSNSYGNISGNNSPLLTHALALPRDLSPETVYHYRVRSTDASGNEKISIDNTFTTAADPADSTDPVISGVTIGTPTTTSVTITWTTDEVSNSYLGYSEDLNYALEQGNPVMTRNHSVSIVGLEPATTYHFRVKSTDPSDNLSIDNNNSQGYEFITNEGDNPPTILSPGSRSLTTSSAEIYWGTNVYANSYVEYGLDQSYGSWTGSNTLNDSHIVQLGGLLSGVTYNYRIRTKSAAGVEAVSQNYTFDTVGNFITNIATSNIDLTSATFTWDTNQAADSFVEYSTITGFSSGTIFGKSDLGTSHSVILTTLDTGTTYFYKIRSTDSAGNLTISTERNFSTDVDTSDVNAPVISNIGTTNIAYNTATILFTTNENSSSYVEFGIDTEYGRIYGKNDNVMNHSVNLPFDLTPNTTYHYRVRTVDISGNEENSTDNTFTTAADPADVTGPTISAIDIETITTTSATVSWTTNEVSSSYLGYGEDLNYALEQGNSVMTKNHSITLVGLTKNTTYYVRVKSTDPSGNLTIDNNTNQGYLILTLPGDNPPNILSSGSRNLTTSSVEIYWGTNIYANSYVEYGLDESYGSWTGSNTLDDTHLVKLTGLLSGATYNYRIRTKSGAGVEAVSQNYTFTTVGNSITNIGTTNITQSSATLNWNTNETADSFIEYSTTTGFSSGKIFGQNESVTNHSVILTALEVGTTYFYKIRSTDSAGNLTISTERNFSTSLDTSDVTAPVVSGVTIGTTTTTSATITWTTDEISNSYIGYSENLDYDLEQGNPVMTRNHSIVLVGLQPATNYHFRIKSTDSSGNLSIDNNNSQGYEFTTKVGDNPPVISGKETRNIGTTSAEVYWTTDIYANSYIEYGLDETYGNWTGSNTLSDSHLVKISGLSPGETYNFRIRSESAAASEAVSQNYTLTTQEIATTTPTSVGTTTASNTSEESILNTIKNGTVDFVKKVLNIIPETSISEGDFVNTMNSMSPKIVSSPSISSSNITVDPGVDKITITWTTDKKANSVVAYASEKEYDSTKTDAYTTTIGNPNESTIDHSVEIPNLNPNTIYHYQVMSKSELGNLTKSADFTFTTLSINSEIRDLKFNDIGEKSISTSWQTNFEARVMVEILDNITGKSVIKNEETGFSKSHSFETDKLQTSTNYKMKIITVAKDGTVSKESIYPFSTSTSSNPPEISNVRISNALIPGAIEQVQTIISWKTDKPSTSRIIYDEGLAKELKMATNLDKSLVSDHIVVTTVLKTGKVYKFKVESMDSNGSVSLSKDYIIMTPKKQESVINLIIDNFTQSFSFITK